MLALVDWDPGGHTVATSLVEHLARYGLTCPEPPAFLLRPEAFSPEELELFSKGLHGKTPQQVARIRNWVTQTGGIHGQPRGITLNCLQPLHRLTPELERLVAQASRA